MATMASFDLSSSICGITTRSYEFAIVTTTMAERWRKEGGLARPRTGLATIETWNDAFLEIMGDYGGN